MSLARHMEDRAISQTGGDVTYILEDITVRIITTHAMLIISVLLSLNQLVM